MNPIWFVKMAKVARHPPSKKMIILWSVVIIGALVIFGIERYIGWPDFLTVNSRSRGVGL